jgi:hypothetical protein
MDIVTLNKKSKTFRTDSDDGSVFSETFVEEKFEDDGTTLSIESDNSEEEDIGDEHRIIFTEEEKLFDKQIREYTKHPYEQISTEFDDSENEEMIGYDSPDEGSQHNLQYEENEEIDF